MLETPVQTPVPNTDVSVSEGSPERDDAASSSTEGVMAEYFSSMSGPARRFFDDDSWDRLQQSSQSDKIDPKDVSSKYKTLPSQKRSSSSASTTSSSFQSRNPRPPVATLRLSSFGVEKSCPVTQEDIYGVGLNRTDYQNYSFREDSGSSYGWMSQTQPDVDTARPSSATSDEMNDNSLEAVSTVVLPSTIHARQSIMIRQSKGNPSYAKKVNIPIVPILPKPSDAETQQLNRLNRSTSNPPVSPHRINNFVYESSPNRLILDFGDTSTDLDLSNPRTSSPLSGNISDSSSLATSSSTLTLTTNSTTRSHTSIMAKMKETKNTFQKTFGGTMTRRKKHKSGSAASIPDSGDKPPGPPRSLLTSPTPLDKKTSSLSSLSQTISPSTANASRLSVNGSIKAPTVRKPSAPPPPPPPSLSRPSCAPPPPPPPSVISAQPCIAVETIPEATKLPSETYKKAVPTLKSENVRSEADEDIESTLEEFKIDLSTDSDSIPKTGFDFLDNW